MNSLRDCHHHPIPNRVLVAELPRALGTDLGGEEAVPRDVPVSRPFRHGHQPAWLGTRDLHRRVVHADEANARRGTTPARALKAAFDGLQDAGLHRQ